ncbi:heme ABC transporter permease [Caulobacter vibrioides]|uniref:Heme exporter protein C n=2 Tax=Caulobacter vibrioides TaxID=155892 RepID=Q9A294_CAUVC|nr:heme ABC transporter permease [Caulobacter vibrioides]YP_002519159.1 heme chaperone heme-lyase [Caulobacter vibrioides NA1000]AAK25634.1 heme exporter protein C [Caulobacter vibrioides CB15]ACL97251.1 heme chaperone heme-lyase [Caulobacter vibrioides NA1000]ATC30473.1 heme transporter HemC [Caulobacter vibrioides]QXZ52007.1 heme ABC transporter permease [Caulobacter vibrioides]
MDARHTFDFLTNPERFMAFSRWAAPWLGGLSAAAAVIGLTLTFMVPEDYQQGDTVRMMFIHIPAASLSMFIYLCLGIASLLSLVYRHVLADLAAQACAPIGAVYTVLALITGSLWGRPMWGTYWVWDARLTSVLVLLLFYLGYMALRGALEDEQKAARSAAILALVGVINLPVVKFSVDWWNTLHQGSSTFFADKGDHLPAVYAWPAAFMALAYLGGFGALWLVRIRALVWRRKARSLSLKLAEGAR